MGHSYMGSKVMPKFDSLLLSQEPIASFPPSPAPFFLELQDYQFEAPRFLDVMVPKKIVLNGLRIETLKGNHLQTFFLQNSKFEHVSPGIFEDIYLKSGEPIVS